MSANSIDCPNCGHNFVHKGGVREPQPGYSDPLAVLAHSEGLSDLQDGVRSLDTLIYRLNQERANLLRKVNTICDKTGHLPSEIMSNIFQFVRPPIDFHQRIPPPSSDWDEGCRDFRRDTYHREDDYHFDLAGVSYRWRQIVLSTPQLWTSVSIGVWKAFTESHVALLDLYSQCAGDLGMSIELDFRYHAVQWLENNDQHERRASLALVDPIIDAFYGIGPKIHHVSLISPPWEMFLYHSCYLSLCSSLILHGRATMGRNSPPAVMDFPSLQRVLVHDIHHRFILPWSFITILELEEVPSSVSLDALTKCVNLIKFSNRINYSNSEPFPGDREPIVHENLESMLCDDDVNLYARFRFPKLRILQWDHMDLNSPQDCTLRTQIFSNLPSTLVSLTFSRTKFNLDHLKKLLLCVPQLRELRFFDCADCFIRTALQNIGRPPYSPKATAVSPIFLPYLRKLSIVSDAVISLGRVIGMLEALSSVGTREEGFHLEVSKIHRDEAASQRLQALVSSGFNVEITTGVEIPDMFSGKFPWW